MPYFKVISNSADCKGIFLHDIPVRVIVLRQCLGNKAEWQISKRALQENKARPIFRKTHIFYPLIPTRIFLKHRFEIRPFALLPTSGAFQIFRLTCFYVSNTSSFPNRAWKSCLEYILYSSDCFHENEMLRTIWAVALEECLFSIVHQCGHRTNNFMIHNLQELCVFSISLKRR